MSAIIWAMKKGIFDKADNPLNPAGIYGHEQKHIVEIREAAIKIKDEAADGEVCHKKELCTQQAKNLRDALQKEWNNKQPNTSHDNGVGDGVMYDPVGGVFPEQMK